MNKETCMHEMKERLQSLQPTHLEVIDDSAEHIGHHPVSGGHYTVNISSPLFANQSQVKQHQMIYAALGDMLPDAIHALRIKVITD